MASVLWYPHPVVSLLCALFFLSSLHGMLGMAPQAYNFRCDFIAYMTCCTSYNGSFLQADIRLFSLAMLQLGYDIPPGLTVCVVDGYGTSDPWRCWRSQGYRGIKSKRKCEMRYLAAFFAVSKSHKKMSFNEIPNSPWWNSFIWCAEQLNEISLRG